MFDVVREIYRSLVNQQHLVVLVIISLLGAATGPFGSFEYHSFWVRLGYWSIVTAFSMVFGRASLVISRRIVPNKYPVLQDLLLVVLVVVFFAPPLWFLTTEWVIRNPSVEPTLLRMAYYVASVSACICILRRLLSKAGIHSVYGKGKVVDQNEPRLVRRLSSNFTGPIVRLAGHDHFVDIVSEKSIESIRMRFSDAIEEMDTVSGYLTHRSHWVSADAVISAQRNKGKTFLVLVNGDKVPVSRKYKSELENAGIISS